MDYHNFDLIFGTLRVEVDVNIIILIIYLSFVRILIYSLILYY